MTGFWYGRRTLVTGSTGFKGAWLSLWLQHLGAEVRGLGLDPQTRPSLFAAAGLAGPDHRLIDVRDATAVKTAIEAARPQVIFHLAAQALVRASYQDPVGTFATNVMGTLHVLEAARTVPGVAAVVVVTTDKVYENPENATPFAESDRLGGKDPYSSSKACAELVTQSFRDSFLGATGAPRAATARAGNVVGGGDWSHDRLVPDIVRAHAAGQKIMLRYPEAVRPWQHVLEPLRGYLMLAQQMFEAPATAPPAVNFGPAPESFLSVSAVVERVSAAFGGQAGWELSPGAHLPEAKTLTLSSKLARRTLGWTPLLTMPDTIGWTADWYRDFAAGGDARQLSLAQIRRYEELCSQDAGIKARN
jgi:CDP-glucose 4,6-dehydratase